MAASSKLMIGEAERRFPVRIRVVVPPDGLGTRLDRIKDWLDENCGADGWAITPSGVRGVLNDAIAVHFSDAALAGAFVARWCRGYRAELVERLSDVSTRADGAADVAGFGVEADDQFVGERHADRLFRPFRHRSGGDGMR